MPASGSEAGRIALRHLKTYRGPSPWGDEPVIVAVMEPDRQALAEGPGRCARIAQACATWFSPPDTARQSPNQGEEIAAFLAAWGLALLNKGGAFLHHARALRADERLHICLGYHREELTIAAMQLATELFAQIDTASPAAIESNLQAFWRAARTGHPDYQIRFLMLAARAAGIPCLPFFPGHRLWQFGWGKNGNVFFESEPKGDSAIGWKVARDKTASKAIFASLGVRTPAHVLARSEADLPAAASAIGWPCVVKPVASGRSRGVTTDIDSMARLTAAFRQARALDKGYVMIERQVEGEVYRIVVARGKTACIIHRSAPYVIGDGRRSLRELIDAANAATAEQRAAMPELLGPIPLDNELQVQLSQQGLTLDGIAPAGSKIMLRRIPLLESGAIYSDATAQAHPDIDTMAVLLAESLGLEFCGIDFVSRDISRSCAEEGAVLEINTTPGLRVPLIAGMAAEDIGRLVLGDTAGRIPVTLVLASGPDLERLAAELRFASDRGWVIGDSCGLGSLRLADAASETSTPQPGRTAELVLRLLQNPLAAELTVACTPGDLAEAGLPIDRFDRIVACPADLDPAWREVLAQRTDRWIDVPDARGALALLTAMQTG